VEFIPQSGTQYDRIYYFSFQTMTLPEIKNFMPKTIAKDIIKHASIRPDWDQYFMLSAVIAATRASCIKFNS